MNNGKTVLLSYLRDGAQATLVDEELQLTGWDLPRTAGTLARIARFNGNTPQAYSVAQHSVLVAFLAAEAQPADFVLQVAALLHDAHEAIVGDLIAPLKPKLPGWSALEAGAQRAVLEVLTRPDAYALPSAASWPLRTQAADVLSRVVPYDREALTLEVRSFFYSVPQRTALRALAPKHAERLFIDVYEHLRKWRTLSLNPEHYRARSEWARSQAVRQAKRLYARATAGTWWTRLVAHCAV